MSQAGKILILGLDGASFRVLLPWIETGRLPHIEALMKRGCWGTLRTIVPAITPPAWTSFFTGRNPGKHGIYNFTAYLPGQYETTRLVTTRDIRCDTMWSLLSAGGKRVGVMNVPMSYPVWPLNGFMISCVCTPLSVGVATHPPELKTELGADYQTSERLRIKVPPGHPAYKAAALAYLDEVARITEQHGNAALGLMKSKPWDVFTMVFMTLDRLQHFFWRYLDPSSAAQAHGNTPPLDPEIEAQLRAILNSLDDWVGRLVEQAGPGATVFVVSDHGFAPDMSRAVNVHRLFKDRGWLARDRFWFAKRIYQRMKARLAGSERRYSVDKKTGVILWAKTKAWAEIFGPRCIGVRINRAGVYPKGCVTDSEYPRLRDEIRELLAGLKDPDGTVIVRESKLREELFSGPHAAVAPDLICFLRDPYTLPKSVGRALRTKALVWPIRSHLRDGNHEPEGVYIAAGPAIQATGRNREHSILDVAPTILTLSGLAVPTDMDGEAMTELLAPDFAVPPIVRQAAPTAAAAWSGQEFKYNEEDEAEIRARLENLGYLE